MAEAVIPDQVEWMAGGPAGDCADWNEREDQDGRLKGETGDDESEAKGGG
jgi:hypothetical protein